MNDLKKILIVEDEVPQAKALELRLRQSGYYVHCAFDGNQALEELEAENYDLILLDLIMPHKDGWDVMSRINQLKMNIKVAVISNLSQKEDIEKAKNMGAVDFMIKTNTTLDEIIEKVKIFLQPPD